MRIVVTGATGFIGRKLLVALRAREAHVTVLSRGRAELGDGVDVRQWDPRPGREIAWMEHLDGADAVVHLAGAGVMDERWTPERLDLIRSSRADSTALVAEAIVRAKRPPTVLVSSSAVGIYGMRSDDRIFDEDGAHGTDVLAKVCEVWETSAEPARAAGCRVTHPRIGIALGKDGGALAKMVPPFRAFVGGPVAPGTQYMSWVHASDVVRALLFAIDEVALTGAYNVVAPTPCTSNELAKALGAVLHRPSALRVPTLALKLVLGESAKVLQTGQRCVPKKLLELGFRFEHPSLEEALRSELSAGSAE